nr:putative zinc finger protein 286B isoform X2 [Aedes albopictus]
MKDSDELELQVNADEMCRTCLGQFPTGQLKPIFCNEILDGKIISFPKVLESTVGIKPAKNEVFPKNVCVDCKSKLKELFSFREKTTKSFNLLYEIFGIEKPPVSQPLKKELSAAGTQTCQLIINEEDLETCHQYLTITRAAKPTTSDAACQAGPKTEESLCQTESLAVTKKDASTQIDHPSLQNFEISPVEEETGSQTNETLYVEETTEMDDDNFSQVDVIDDMGAAENIVDDTDLELDDNEMPALLEQDEFNFVEKSSDKSDNHDKAEQGIEHETIEYLTYEVIREEEEEEPETEVKSSRSFKEATSKVGIEKKCNYCQFVSSVKSAFNDHYAIHEQTIETIFDRVDYYRCTNCKVVYPTLSKLQDHATTEECNAIDREDFEESSDAIVHEQFYNVGLDICLPRMKTFHLNERSQVVCGFCSLAFETWSDALEHYSSIHENEETSAEDVSRIWNTYGYDRIHRCGICKDQFADASFIRQHVYFHRSRYDCPYDCSGTFRDFFKLTVHLNQNHLCKKTGLVADAKVLPSQPDMVCQICFKRFTSEASYKVHTKNHFANRRYTCTECPKAFLQKCDLTIHMRSHTDEHMKTHGKNVKFE